MVQNKLGLHARAAGKLVEVAQNFNAAIEIVNGDIKANGKSIMSILLLQASRGSELEVRAEGEDAEDAVDAIVKLIDNLFGEDE